MADSRGKKVKCGSCSKLTNDEREICDFCGANIWHADGSPFRLSAAPAEPAEDSPRPKVAEPPPEPAPFVPPPLPVPAKTDTEPTAAAQSIFGVFAAWCILRVTVGATHADWLAAGLFAAVAEAVLLNVDSRLPRRLLWGILASLLALLCLYKSGIPVPRWMPAGAQGLEMWILLITGLSLGAAACYIGFIEVEKRLPLALLAGSTVVMVIWAALVRLPPEAPWKEFIGILVADARMFIGSGGARRWGGIALVYAGSYIFFPGKKDYGPRPKIVNWSA